MNKCDGKEEHFHYVLDSGDLFYHTHAHTQREVEFNILHHHAPIEHDNFTIEELQKGARTVEVPF